MAEVTQRSVLSRLMMIFGLLEAVPLLVIPFYPENSVFLFCFLLPSLFSLAAGVMCCFRRKNLTLFDASQSGIGTVLFIWIWSMVIGALPFFLSGQLRFVQALFESVSGWTTAGLSVMDPSSAAPIFLFYRSFMQYCGGIGFIVMMLFLISDRQSMALFSAEGHPDKLLPNLKKTARVIVAIYMIVLLIGSAAYRLCGMPLFESLCHAMCSFATGGFSVRTESLGWYNSLSVELVTVLLMLLGATNFAVILLAARWKWNQTIRVSEVRFMAALLIVFVPLAALSLFWAGKSGLIQAFRDALFNVVSVLTTTGYSTVSYAEWPPFALGLLILLMLIGGGMGSTSGGLKLIRAYLMLRIIWQDVQKRFVSVRQVKSPAFFKAQGRTEIDEDLRSDTLGFVGSYLLLFVAGSLLLTLTADCTLTEAVFEFASTLGTVGVSIGLTGPETNDATLIVEIIGMILGRLEIFIVPMGFCLCISRFRFRAEQKRRIGL
ncbi:MAG: potassium transporter TrkG [Desulfovibrionaceae bacterium]|nr:potassium transporter TrkG [Desulfovibrionaceae bacterium]